MSNKCIYVNCLEIKMCLDQLWSSHHHILEKEMDLIQEFITLAKIFRNSPVAWKTDITLDAIKQSQNEIRPIKISNGSIYEKEQDNI